MAIRVTFWTMFTVSCFSREDYTYDSTQFCQSRPRAPQCQNSVGQGGDGGGGATIDQVGGAAGASICDDSVVIVGEPDLALPTACVVDTLSEGLQRAKTRLVVSSKTAASDQPIKIPEGVSFEGRTTELAISAPVTLSDGAGLTGFKLNGGGVVVSNGTATLTGPLEIIGAPQAGSISDGATLVINGTPDAPVRFADNALGIIVASKAGLTIDGGELPGGVMFDATKNGAGIVIKLSTGNPPPIAIKAMIAKDHRVDGAIVIERARTVSLRASRFENNVIGLNVNAANSTLKESFANLTLSDLFFVDAARTGAAICGSGLGAAGFQLALNASLAFPSGTCPKSTVASSCEGGIDVGSTNGNNFALTGCP